MPQVPAYLKPCDLNFATTFGYGGLNSSVESLVYWYSGNGMAIGEAGSLSTAGGDTQEITVSFTEPLTDPVIVMTGTQNGGHPYTFRITNQTFDDDGNTTSFSFVMEEWEYLDGVHPAVEDVNWIAIEEGVHTLPDGRVIEAGTTDADDSTSSVELEGEFDAPPVVLTSVMSNNDSTTVDSDGFNVTADGFDLALQEEEAQDGVHGTENVGWIAIQPGGSGDFGTALTADGVDENTDTVGFGSTIGDAVVIAKTQTMNGTDTAHVAINGQTDTNVGVFVMEEKSQDSEVDHTDETVGIVAFPSGLIEGTTYAPCFTAGTLIDTPNGAVPIEWLSPQDSVCLSDDTRGVAKILRIYKRTLSRADLEAAPCLFPIRIVAGALGHGLPRQDLLVSRQHRMLVSARTAQRITGTSEVLIPANKLTPLPGIFVDYSVQSVTYFHLLFDRHEVIFAEGAPSESLYTGPQALNALPLEARREIKSLFPELGSATPKTAYAIPPAKMQKAVVSRLAQNGQSPLCG